MTISPSIYNSWHGIQLKKYEKIIKIMPDLSNKKILDIGIGSGYFEEFLNSKGIKADIIGLDISKEMIKQAKILMPLIIADGDELPFPDNSFDMIICLDTIHLIKEHDFSRILKPSSLALISIFFNKQDYEQKRNLLIERLKGLEIIKEISIEGKENELVMLAKKSHLLQGLNSQ
jgi:ubiquinone/menaquinone biosynthesis C-methylase UbiE